MSTQNRRLERKSSNFLTACQRGKQCRKNKRERSLPQTEYHLGELLHMDICSPIKPLSLGKAKFVLNIVEQYSRYCFSYTITSKSGETVLEKIKQTVHWIETQCGVRVKFLRSDQGTEFQYKDLCDYCLEKGITQEFTSTYTPEQNSIVERINRWTLFGHG